MFCNLLLEVVFLPYFHFQFYALFTPKKTTMRECNLYFLEDREWWNKARILLGIWTFVLLFEAGMICILFPLTQLKDDFGGKAVYLVTKPSFSELHDKTHIGSFAFVFTNKEKIYVLIEQSTYTLGVRMLSKRFLLNVNYWHLSSSMEVECMFSLCTTLSWFRSSLCWCEAETGQGNSFDDEIRGSQADCLLAFREPYKLRATPSPCLDITCSFEFQITGAIDLHDLS